jgi:predicted enzyme related to lactoylglutathione lyase
MHISRRTGVWALVILLAAEPTTAAEQWWPPITDPPTGEHHPGRWVWAELMTRDVGRAAAFYGRVFGWTFETFGPEDDLKTYTVVSSGGVPIGGMVFIDHPDAAKARDARWVGLMSVPDVDAAARQIATNGGRTLVAPGKMGERGRAALFADPEGAVFGVIRSATGDPEEGIGANNQWLWSELWADDPDKMAAFYQPLGGYEVVHGTVPGETTGVHLAKDGAPRAGILRKPAPVPSTWVPYVRVESVADAVARARAAGGNVVIEPMRARGTNVALILDPTGAPVAVAEWSRSREVAK